MSCSFGCSKNVQGCPQTDGCIPGVCPDFMIKRHDTKPSFKILMEDCDGPMDLTGLVLEASMWAKAKLKKDLLPVRLLLTLKISSKVLCDLVCRLGVYVKSS